MPEDVSTIDARPAPGPIAWPGRVLLWGSLVVISGLSWLYLVWMPMTASDLGATAAHLFRVVPAGADEMVLMFLMWAVMMVAMMLPSAAPMIETFARIAAYRGEQSGYRVALFVVGYLTIWTVFSGIATIAQVALQHAGIVTAALSTTPIAGSALLAGAGIYQVTPLKDACLNKCRSPLGILMAEWRDGAAGAFVIGLRHGAFCTGCCAMLMLLLFVFGVMNLLWVAALSIFVLLEKSLPQGRAIARVSGYGMLIAAAVRLV